jgi:hypothetical protein
MTEHINNGFQCPPKSVAGITFEAQVVMYYAATENTRWEGENVPPRPDFGHEMHREVQVEAVRG